MKPSLISSSLRGLLLVLLLGTAARAVDVKIVGATNGTLSFVSSLSITFAGTGGSLYVVPETVISPAGCAAPAVTVVPGTPTGSVTLDWGAPCVPPGATVLLVASTATGTLSFSSGSWTTAAGATVALPGASVADALGAAGTLSYPVAATVTAPATGVTAPATIGTVTVTTGALGPGACHALSLGLSAKIKAQFDFAPGFGWIDAPYDVKWVNVLTAYIPMPGCPVPPVVPSTPGAPLSSFPCANMLSFPAIDPAPCATLPAGCPPAAGGCVPPGMIGADGEPYYWGDPFWTSGLASAEAIHDECTHSRFCDFPTVCVVVFSLFPVLESQTSSAMEFCILDGISWFVGTNGAAGIVGPAPANPGLVGAALAGGISSIPAWSALPSSGCPISAPTTGSGCNTFSGVAATIWPECPPELGSLFTWNVAGLFPTGGTPVPVALPIGVPPITVLAGAPLAAPFDLSFTGLPSPPGSCFLFLPLGIFLPGPAVPPGGAVSMTIAVPLTPALSGIPVYLQTLQLASTVLGPFPGFVAATPFLTVTILP
ncbi:MAG: hypothetical protein L0323_15995 [Planctomycetes bacterium]|nr:hypothetical protein [Planctomycetota bacterium]